MKKSSKNKSTNKKIAKHDSTSLIIGGCTILGLGFGFIFNQVFGGLFIGLGSGLIFAAIMHYKRY